MSSLIKEDAPLGGQNSENYPEAVVLSGVKFYLSSFSLLSSSRYLRDIQKSKGLTRVFLPNTPIIVPPGLERKAESWVEV